MMYNSIHNQKEIWGRWENPYKQKHNSGRCHFLRAGRYCNDCSKLGSVLLILENLSAILLMDYNRQTRHQQLHPGFCSQPPGI